MPSSKLNLIITYQLPMKLLVATAHTGSFAMKMSLYIKISASKSSRNAYLLFLLATANEQTQHYIAMWILIYKIGDIRFPGWMDLQYLGKGRRDLS